MGIDYSGVNPATDLGLDQWSTGEIGQISQAVDDLKNHQPVTLADLDRSTILAARGLGHFTYGPKCESIIQAMYDLSQDVHSQSHVVGHLLEPQHVDLLSNLLNLADNPMATRLGQQGIDRLIQIAGYSSPLAQSSRLFGWARSAVAPGQFTDDTELEQRVVESVGALGDGLAEALSSNDLATAESIVSQASDAELEGLARFIAELGENMQPALHEMMSSSDHRCSNFAFNALALIGEMNLGDQPAYQAEVSDSGDIRSAVDTAALESLLLAPEHTPMTLARQFLGAPGLSAGLLEIIVGKA